MAKKKRTPTKHNAIHRDLMSKKYRQRIKPDMRKKINDDAAFNRSLQNEGRYDTDSIKSQK